MIKKTPVGQVEPLDTVAQNFDSAETGVGTISHGLYMMLPVQPVVDKEAKISDNGGGCDSDI